MRINLASVLVDDQEKALRFYTDVLGFVKKNDDPDGRAPLAHRRLAGGAGRRRSCCSSPTTTPRRGRSRTRWSEDGIPFTSFAVDDVADGVRPAEGAGRAFTQEPTEMGPVTTAVFDDTCGNLIQIAAM